MSTELQTIRQKIEECGFVVKNHFHNPKQNGATKHIASLNLSDNVAKFLQNKVNGNIWEHQYTAIENYCNGANVCIATSTSSGKSYAFYSAGMELLARNPNAKIIAVYPLKALGSQQLENWKNAIKTAELTNIKVGKIDGDIKEREQRLETLRECSVVIITPDTIHTFLLGKLNDDIISGTIKNYLRQVKLVIIDEVHTYTGVFGSNSGYLYRRLNHAIDALSGSIP
jgi:DEAD/DEAH box helicase domain-containing protein